MKLAIIAYLFFTSSLYAEILHDRIHSIERIENSSEYLVKFENGRVAFVQRVGSLARGHLIEGRLDKQSNLREYKTLETEPTPTPRSLEPETAEYVPSVLTPQQLADFWNNLKTDYKRKSECSDRAYVWAFEGWKKHGYQFEMAYAFFTASYINRHRFKWWFHVAPLVTVNMGDRTEKMVIDYLFHDRPITIKEWTDLMVFTKRDCKVTDRFSEYDVNPQTEDCYFMSSSMYYRIPAQLVDLENKNIQKLEFNASEVRMSYRLGFESGADGL